MNQDAIRDLHAEQEEARERINNFIKKIEHEIEYRNHKLSSQWVLDQVRKLNP